MSFTFLAATGAESSQESFAEMFRYAPWKSIQDAGKHYYNAKETAFCLGSPFGIKLKPLTGTHGEGLRNASAAASLAQTFLPLGQTIMLTEFSEDLTEKALDCGRRWQESLRKCNLELSVLKTPRTYALRDLSESSKTLTAWGITQQGVCLDVALSAQTILEPGCSLLPTPMAHNAKEGAYPAEYTRNTPTLAASIGGKINPDWNEWRMGCPIKWGDCAPLEIDKFLSWLRLHGKYYHKD